MNRLLTSRLVARSEIRQIEASNLADAAALAVDAVVARQWRRILSTLGTPIIAHAQQHAYRELLAVLPAAKASVADSLRRIARWGHTTARASLRTTLPLDYLKAAAVVSTAESLMEDTGPGDKPGILELILRSMGGSEESVEARIRSLLSPTLNVNQQKNVYLDYLFPPPSPAVVDEIVYAPVNGATWEQRLEGATRTSVTPAQLAGVVAQGVAQGKSHRDIAKDLLPVVDGVRSSARRIARTECLRVAGAIQERAWDGLGDMMVGLQIHATLDERTRPAHRLRSGTIYYRDPKPGQLSMDRMPHPPLEADGTMAWNCILPGQYVQGPIRKVLKAWYSGQAFEIRSASGSVSFVTANHPVLTKDGFAFARQIKQGDYLWSYAVGEELFGRANEDQAPALIEDVAMSFKSLWGTKRAAALDFYGDGKFLKGDVRVVGADLPMVLMRNSEHRQQRKHFDLEAAHNHVVSGGNLSDATILRHLRPLQRLRCRLASWSDAVVQKDFSYHAAGDVKVFRNGVFGDARDVHCDDGRMVDMNSSTNTHGVEAAGNRLVVNAEVGRAFANCPTLLDREFLKDFFVDSDSFLSLVTSVRSFHYYGPVYDVETDTGVFLVSSDKTAMTLQKQCRCFTSPVLSPPDYLDDAAKKLFAETPAFRNDPATYAEWFASADEKSRRLAVGTRRYEAARAATGFTRPPYEVFVDPTQPDGILSVTQLRAETPGERMLRVAVVGRIVAERRELIRRVERLGLA